MREKKRICIATTNQGKLADILHVLQDLPFDFVSLRDLSLKEDPPEETETALFGNAVLKAKHYAKATGMISIADDTGLFVDALGGWPGVASARIAADNEKRNTLLLEKMNGIPQRQRGASFRAVIATFDPNNGNVFTSSGEIRGAIATERVSADNGFGYDPFFIVPELKKTFAEMTLAEKNALSHRGKALYQMKYILQNEYGGRHLVVPVAFILRDGKVLMSKRNDPMRPSFHGKWEFPGGRMDLGETLEENLIRETWEEVGYKIKPVKRLSQIWVEHQSGHTWGYQVYLIPYACRIIEGGGTGSDAEVLETRWFDPDEVPKMELIGANKKMYEALLPELKTFIT